MLKASRMEMNGNKEGFFLREWQMLVGAVLLLGASLWLLAFADESAWRGYQGSPYVLRQGIFGLLALVLAWGIGRFSLHRPLLRHWYLFPLLLLLVMVAAPISEATGSGRLVYGQGWWTRSIGVSAFVLALIYTASFVLPRFARGERGGAWAMAILIALLVAIPLFFLNRWGMMGVGIVVIALASSVTFTARKLTMALSGLVLAFLCALLVQYAVAPEAMQRTFSVSIENSEKFQLLQAFLAVHSGGLLGWESPPVWIPEWHTDFMFARLCSAGGWVSGLAALAAIGMIFTLAWRIAIRQEDLRARALAAACAGVLILPALLHVAVNLGLFPTLGINFPFLSYAPNLLLLNGLLLGFLLSLAREPSVPGEVIQSRWPKVLALVLIWGLIALFALRIGTLVYASPHLQELQQRQIKQLDRSSREAMPLPRGLIVDLNGRVLARNVTSFTVCADPQWLVETNGLECLPELARLIGMDEQVLSERITGSSRRYMRLLKNAPLETAEAIRRMNRAGVFVETVPARDYPESLSLAHLVGFVIQEDLQGGGGIELMRNNELINGQDIALTLDIDWQESVQSIAEAAAMDTKAKQVQIMVMNPLTGAIRAAAQVPAAHGRNSATADSFSLNWRAVIDLFEPGGLMMPLVMASALEAGVITDVTRIDCENGVWNYHEIPLRDARPFGELPLDEIVAHASNIGMAKIGLLMGQQPLHDALVKWGLPEKCSVGGFGGVPSGRLYPPARWSELEITRIPMGHSCAFSLLQVVRAYSAFFNEGQMVEPYLIETGNPAQLRSVLKSETAAAIHDMLGIVVEKGTGRAARLDGVPVFGKTAVVQKLTPDSRGYSAGKIQTAFMGGFEQDTKEPLLIAVWLDEPEREVGFNPAPAVFQKVATTLTRDKRMKINAIPTENYE